MPQMSNNYKCVHETVRRPTPRAHRPPLASQRPEIITKAAAGNANR